MKNTPTAWQAKINRQSDTIKMQASEIAMLRRKVGQLREELEQFRDRNPNPAVVKHNARCMI